MKARSPVNAGIICAPGPNAEIPFEHLRPRFGEIWAGEMNAGRIVRFNPKANRWTEYVLHEPISHNRRTWIDNATDPVTIWYVDHDGIMVRINHWSRSRALDPSAAGVFPFLAMREMLEKSSGLRSERIPLPSFRTAPISPTSIVIKLQLSKEKVSNFLFICLQPDETSHPVYTVFVGKCCRY
jgi:hypothetical protein